LFIENYPGDIAVGAVFSGSGVGLPVPSLQAAGEEEEAEGMRVDFYLVVFLKFIASIVPTIEVDSTTSF